MIQTNRPDHERYPTARCKIKGPHVRNKGDEVVERAVSGVFYTFVTSCVPLRKRFYLSTYIELTLLYFLLSHPVELIGIIHIVPHTVESTGYGRDWGEEGVAHPDGKDRVFLPQ